MSLRSFLIRGMLVLVSALTIFIVSTAYLISYRIDSLHQKTVNQYLNSVYEIHKGELVGNLLINDQGVLRAFLDEVSKNRGIGLEFVSENFNYRTGKFRNSSSKKFIIENDGKALGELKVSVRDTRAAIAVEVIVLILFGVIFILGGAWWCNKKLKNKLIKPLNALLLSASHDHYPLLSEESKTITEISKLALELERMNEEVKDRSNSEALYTIASQVSHDIRSPLASLSMAIEDLNKLYPITDLSAIIRRSLIRINDIANNLLNDYKNIDRVQETNSNVEHIATAIDSIISEKRFQHRDKFLIDIISNVNTNYGLFSNINLVEF